MKNAFIILALVAISGCSNMPWDSRSSSSGSMSSSGMESGSTGASQRGAYSEETKGLYNPYNPSSNPDAPMPITP